MQPGSISAILRTTPRCRSALLLESRSGKQTKELKLTGMANYKAPNGGRGNIWRYSEVEDLLDIWGEEQIQLELRQHHRNIEVFTVVAKGMAARGHMRSAEECRTKTKSLRLEYKKVVVHNSMSGNKPKSCPFYDKLHEILHGDADIVPKCVASSLRLREDSLHMGAQQWDHNTEAEPSRCSTQQVTPRGQSPHPAPRGQNSPAPSHCPPPVPRKFSLELFSEEFQTNDVQQHLLDGPPEQRLDSDETQIEGSQGFESMEEEDLDSESSCVPENGRLGGHTSPRTSQADADQPSTSDSAWQGRVTPPRHQDPVDTACLTPGSRLRLIRGRDKRPKGNQRADRLARDILQQSAQQHRALMTHLSADSRNYDAWERRMEEDLRNDLEEIRRDREDRRRDREERRELMRAMSECMTGTLSIFRDMFAEVHRLTSQFQRGSTLPSGPSPMPPPQPEVMGAWATTPTSSNTAAGRVKRTLKVKQRFSPDWE